MTLVLSNRTWVEGSSGEVAALAAAATRGIHQSNMTWWRATREWGWGRRRGAGPLPPTPSPQHFPCTVGGVHLMLCHVGSQGLEQTDPELMSSLRSWREVKTLNVPWRSVVCIARKFQNSSLCSRLYLTEHRVPTDPQNIESIVTNIGIKMD